MSIVQIITDTTCTLPPDLSHNVRRHIRFVRTSVEFRQESWVEGAFTLDDFYTRLLSDPDLPHTSQPGPAEYLAAYEAASAEGPVLAIFLSGALSSTYATGVAMAREFRRADITVYDSQFMSTALGYMVAEAAQMAVGGASKEQIIAQLNWRKSKTALYFTLDTLEFVRRGGRVNMLQAGLATMLDLKPILVVHDGRLLSVGRIRSRRRAIETVLAKAEAHAQMLRGSVWVAAMHGRALDTATELLRAMTEKLPVTRGFISDVPASIALHGGPGVVGVTVTPNGR